MLANTILNVVIGLVFVFFVCSLAVSGINEAVRTLFNTRAKALWKTIERILSEDDEAPQQTGVTARIGEAPTRADSVSAPTGVPSTAGTSQPSIFDQLFNHPIIARLDPARLDRPSKISHIPPTDFARALVDILTPDQNGQKKWDQIGDGIDKLPPVLRSQFQLLYEEAGRDVLEFRKAVEGWFDSAMERLSRWYKKRTRWAMLVYGVVVAIGLNVSAVHVTAELYRDDIIRATVVELAEATAEQSAADIDGCTDRECVEAEVQALVDTGLPVLWRDCDPTSDFELCGFEDGGAVAGTLLGWLITAAALSVGASFWFAILKRAFRLRPS